MSALDDLVKSGKLRYVGISDAPPWKVALAQNDGSLPRLESHDWATDSVFAAGMGSSRPGSPFAFQYRETPKWQKNQVPTMVAEIPDTGRLKVTNLTNLDDGA